MSDDGEKVVSLFGGPIRRAPTPDEAAEGTDPPAPEPSVVRACEDLLALARSGRLRVLLATGFTHDGLRAKAISGEVMRDVYAIRGALGWLESEYVDMVLERHEESD